MKVEFDQKPRVIKRNKELSLPEKEILSTLINIDLHKDIVQASDKWLAEENGICVRSVSTIRKRLKELGLIKEIHTKTKEGKDNPTVFQLQREEINRFFGGEIYEIKKETNKTAQPINNNNRPFVPKVCDLSRAERRKEIK